MLVRLQELLGSGTMTPPNTRTTSHSKTINSVDLYNALPIVNPFAFLCLIDLRTTKEWQALHVSDSFNLPQTSAKETILKGLEANLKGHLCELVVFYDSNGFYDEKVMEVIVPLVSRALCPRNCKFLEGGFEYFFKEFPFVCVAGDQVLDPAKPFPSIIVPKFLYLGGYDCTHKETLDYMEITYVLNCASECENKGLLGCKYLNFDLNDTSDQVIEHVFKDAFRFLDEAYDNGKSVLVHCKAGISRSSTIVVAYLMKTKGWQLETSLKFVSERRSIIVPNRGFMQQLVLYEKKVTKEVQLLRSMQKLV